MAAPRVKLKVKASQTAKAKTARRVARRDAAANDPAAITAPLTPKTLNTEIGAATRLKFGGQERQIAGEQRVSDEQQRRIGSWYDEYQARVEQSRAATAQGYQDAGQRIEQAAASDTASTGSEDAQKALAARQALVRSGGGMVAAQGANQNAYLADRGRIGGLQKLQAHQGESSRKRALADRLTALEGEKGDFGVTLRRDARTSERNNLLAIESLKTNQQKAADSAAADRRTARDRKADNRRQALADNARAGDRQADNARLSAKDKAAAEKEAYLRDHNLGPYKPAKGPKAGEQKPLTDAQKRDRRKIATAQSQFEGPYKRNYRKYYDEGVAHGQEPALLHAGYELSTQGYVGPNTARQLRELGYTIPPKWRKRPPVGAHPKGLGLD